MMRLVSAPSLASAGNLLRDILALRVYGLVAQLLVIVLAVTVLHAQLMLRPLGLILALGMAFAGWTAYRLRRDWPVTLLECFFQLLIDILLLTFLLYFSGGAANPFVSLYLLPIMIGATALPARLAWLLSVAGVLAYSALMAWYEPLVLPAGSAAFHLHVLGMWLNFILSTVLITYFIGRMALGLRRRDAQLAKVREQRLRDEQIVAIGSLAAGAAHELSTPLATMNVIAGELLDEHAGHTSLVDQLTLLRAQIRLCKQVLTRLSQADNAGRAESGQAVPLDEWLKARLSDWQLMRPQVILDLRWPEQRRAPCIIAGDALGQALLNLCNNAADAGNEQVEIDVGWDGHEIRLDILDRGHGFPQEISLGTAFFTTKREQGGIGIGFLLANASIEQYGGRVSLSGRSGGGACVTVILPVFAPGQEKTRAPLAAG